MMRDEFATHLRSLSYKKSFLCWEPRHGEWMLAMRAAADRIERQADEIMRLRQDKVAGFAYWRAAAKIIADGRRTARARAEKAEARVRELEAAATRRAPEHFTGACYGPFTKAGWQTLPMQLRQTWWKETDYGSVPPSSALIDECRDYLSNERAGCKL